MEAKKQAFIAKLHELFQINNGLDFGIYRIINEKKSDIETYIKKTLPEKISEFLAKLEETSPDNKNEIKKLEDEISAFEKLGNNAEALKQIEINRNKISQLQQASLNGNTEEEIYDKLLTFFSRYYDEGDFISQRRYKDGVYAVPYSGEEVKLHWANHDQYYIKTGENFKDYTFNIEDNFNVTFILTDAEIERDNNKSDDKKVYVLAEPSEEYEKPIYILENEEKTRAELFIRLSYKYGNDIKQKESSEAILNEVKLLENDNDISSNIKSKIGNLFKSRDEKDKNKVSHLEYHLNKYIAKNSFDFFIHKDLKKFLMQELDFYIKNEVIYLQDLYGSKDNIKNLDMYVKKASVIQNIGSEIITFLAQQEDFQKELYLKKKFVTETNYCITLDKIDEKYYDEIITNQAQIEEWKKLFAIDEIKGDLHTKEYSEPLTKEFLQENEYLVLDTAFFSEEFKEKIIADIENLDEKIDGLLIHGDNFQALNLMQEKYKEQVQCVYIDPPYNAKSSEILYKNTFKHSAWLSMMFERIILSQFLLNDNFLFITAIDENEQEKLGLLFDYIFYNNKKACISIVHNPRGQQGKNVSYLHESAYFIYPNDSIKYISNFKRNEIDRRNLRDSGTESDRNDAATCFYPFIVKNMEIVGIGDVPEDDFHPEKSNIILNDGSIQIWPIDDRGNEKKWRYSVNSIQSILSKLEVRQVRNKMQIIFNQDMGVMKSSWTDAKYDASEYGTKLLQNIFSTEYANNYAKNLYPKSIYTVYDAIFAYNLSSNKVITILDFFAGSGTTGHAVINLNREDNGKRKYILVEMGEYFDTVTKPRIEKVIYSKDWKDGKPVSREGSSHIFKYIRLESYEDTLNNVEFSKPLVVDDFLQNEYLTKYKIQKEAENSKIYLPAEAIYNPFEFQLKITRKNESRVQKIDLIETFNFLIGLQVNNIYTKKYNALFKTIDTGRLHADIKLDNNGQYIFKIVEGSTLKGEKVLVIWRNIVGDINNNDDLNKNNAVLESVTLKNQIKPADSEYDVIYINCTNSLQNFAKEGSYKVALIEEIMKDKMFSNI